MQISPEAIQTKEVLSWDGVHLLHYPMSSCSQKVRIFLGEKQISWVSHPVDLSKNEQKSSWYLGINSAGVVPVLVHNGAVYNESNDILVYLNTQFPNAAGSYLPESESEQQRARELMLLEEKLHQHLRVVTFTFVMPGRLLNYSFNQQEVDEAVLHFDDVLRTLDERLVMSSFLCGDRLMLPDIAWFITIHRLVLAGYPIEELPRLAAYYRNLLGRPAFRQEADAGALLPKSIGYLFRGLKRLTRTSIRHRLAA
jgi:glutathione S-transferase